MSSARFVTLLGVILAAPHLSMDEAGYYVLFCIWLALTLVVVKAFKAWRVRRAP